MSDAPGGASAAVDMSDDSVVRSHWDDALERHGEMLVLAGNDVTLLSPLGAEAVLVARGGVTIGALRVELFRRFGEPEGDGAAVVRELVASLVARGVMTVDG